MTCIRSFLIATCLMLGIAGIALAQSAEIRLEDGSRWRGEISDMVEIVAREQGHEVRFTGRLKKVEKMYLVIETEIAGELSDKVIFAADVVDVNSVGSGQTTAAKRLAEALPRSASSAGKGNDPYEDDRPGVFVLPLDGPVGQSFRHQEIEMIGEEADKYGPGQIIVLIIRSNGGLVLESVQINEAISELKKRHRVVAWIRKAISAGCSTALACDEIYFTSEGVAGSVTTVVGQRSLTEEEGVGEHVEDLVRVAEGSGYSEHIARAMKLNKYMCSYDKDPETGEVTFYGDLSGEFVLSDGKSNLSFTAPVALHCGFSKGTADTQEDLAKMLDLPEWHEKSDYGRKIAADWQSTYERMSEDINRKRARLSYYKSAGDIEERLGAQIQIYEDFIRYWEREPLIGMMEIGVPKEQLERHVAELRKQLADIKKSRR